VTQALVQAGVAAHQHHEAFHRFFSRGTWKPDLLGRLLFDLVVGLVPLAQLVFSLDDTLCPKRGPKVFGIGSHRDAVLSSGRSSLLLWAARGGSSVARLLMPERPWYHQKVHLSFADILHAAQRLLGQHQPLLPSILESLCPTPKPLVPDGVFVPREGGVRFDSTFAILRRASEGAAGP
jgi:hypothetical protein